MVAAERRAGCGDRPRGALGAACAAAFWAGWGVAAPALAWWGATLVWVLGGAWLLRNGTVAWPQLPKGLRVAVGLVLLWTAWLALVNAKAIGINFILSVFCLVWAADIAAYFGGRAFGRRKLAPSISPGKSWEGVWSGMVGALVLAAVVAAARALAGGRFEEPLRRAVGSLQRRSSSHSA